MWPLNFSENRSAGSTLSKASVTVPGTNRMVKISTLKAKPRDYFFQITKTR
jgi:hypothetical protein